MKSQRHEADIHQGEPTGFIILPRGKNCKRKIERETANAKNRTDQGGYDLRFSLQTKSSGMHLA
jgi:hypothetical protein